MDKGRSEEPGRRIEDGVSSDSDESTVEGEREADETIPLVATGAGSDGATPSNGGGHQEEEGNENTDADNGTNKGKKHENGALSDDLVLQYLQQHGMSAAALELQQILEKNKSEERVSVGDTVSVAETESGSDTEGGGKEFVSKVIEPAATEITATTTATDDLQNMWDSHEYNDDFIDTLSYDLKSSFLEADSLLQSLNDIENNYRNVRHEKKYSETMNSSSEQQPLMESSNFFEEKSRNANLIPRERSAKFATEDEVMGDDSEIAREMSAIQKSVRSLQQDLNNSNALSNFLDLNEAGAPEQTEASIRELDKESPWGGDFADIEEVVLEETGAVRRLSGGSGISNGSGFGYITSRLDNSVHSNKKGSSRGTSERGGNSERRPSTGSAVSTGTSASNGSGFGYIRKKLAQNRARCPSDDAFEKPIPGKSGKRPSTGSLRESQMSETNYDEVEEEDLEQTGWRYLAITAIENTFFDLLGGRNENLTEKNIRECEFPMENHTFHEITRYFDPPNPMVLDFETFVTDAKEVLLDKQNALEFLTASFDFFDMDGDGAISKDDFKCAMKMLHEPLTFVEINEMIGRGEWKDKNFKVQPNQWIAMLSFLLGAQYKEKDGRKQFSVFKANRLDKEIVQGEEFKNPLLRLVGAKFAAYILLRGHKVPMMHSAGEKRFLIGTCLLFTILFIPSLVCSFLYPDVWGAFDANLIVQSLFLLAAEILWECVLSYSHIRFGVKINYTRKLGHLLRLPKYFLAAYIPGFIETPMTLLTAFIFNQLVFALLFCRQSRVFSTFNSFLFQSQDRREDRPYTMRFQITEDLLRYLPIYLPFKAGLLDYLSATSGRDLSAMIFIPIFINTVGDGLAEPVGVMFGKHKYRTKSLYYNGEWWSGSFVRSYEGSSMVFLSTVAILGAQYSLFTTGQFVFLMVLMPPLMTVTEAIAPHTNDGPFLALVGCGLLAIALLAIP